MSDKENPDDFLKFIIEKSNALNDEYKQYGFYSSFAMAWVQEHLNIITERVRVLKGTKEHISGLTVKVVSEQMKAQMANLEQMVGAEQVKQYYMTDKQIYKKLRTDLAETNQNLEIVENSLIVVEQMYIKIKEYIDAIETEKAN